MDKIIRFLSRRNWGIIRYNTIFRNLSALLYLGITRKENDLSFLGWTAIFFLFSVVMTGYGYFVNDLADIEIDRAHGKPNAFLKIPPAQSRLVVMGILAFGLLLAIPFLKDPVFLVVLLLWVFVCSFYSLKPLRFKERGGWGLVATVLAEYTLPILLLFAVFQQADTLAALFFTLFSTARGTAANLSHQLTDYAQDRKTHTTTFAVQKGSATVRRIYPFVLELERLLLGAVVAILILDGPTLTLVQGLKIAVNWPLGIIYLFLLILTIGRSFAAIQKEPLEENDPYNEVRQSRTLDALHVIHHSFPTVMVPFYLACVAAVLYWPNVLLLVIIVLLFKLYSPEFLAKINPKNIIRSR